METGANIGDLSAVSFADFETKNRDDNASFENYGQCQPKHDIAAMTLDLSLGQKSESLFATDQTPTPTRLIKNCDEVGLFEDLQHVNPFDIGFQRAAEQNAVGGGGHPMPVTPARTEAPATDGDSLHTPQVYPLESATLSAPAPPVSNSSSPLDVPVPNVEDLLNTPIAEPVPSTVPSVADTIPPPLQLIQPQLITLVLPAQSLPLPIAATRVSKRSKNELPTHKVRPLILPKPSTTSSPKTPSCTTAVPSSASLTPTSQLPIKERLKAILNNSLHRKPRSFEAPEPMTISAGKRTEDSLKRRRDAAFRYRNKMRREHKEIKDHNVQLQQENKKLRQRIATLERELQQQRNNNNVAGGTQTLRK